MAAFALGLELFKDVNECDELALFFSFYKWAVTFFLQNNYNPCAAEKEINLGNVFKTYTHRCNHIEDFKESLLKKLLLIEYGEPQILLQNLTLFNINN